MRGEPKLMEEKQPKQRSNINLDKVIGRYPREEIIEIAMEQYGEKLTRFAYTYVKDWPKAEDIIQEVFVTCYTKLGTFRGESSFKTWIYRITINRCTDYLRSWSYRNLHFTDKMTRWISGNSDSPESDVMVKNENEALAKHVLTLPIKYREVLLLYYYEELSINEISELLLSKEATIKTRLHRARALLKEVLETEGSAQEWKNV
jgi:RNA polymerase sigma-70 factor, ECF subfamily